MNIIKRAKAPTPKFFRILRNVGLLSAGFGGVLMTSPVELPALIAETVKYLVLAGGIISAVSQVTVDDQVYTKEQLEGNTKSENHE